MGNIKKSSSRMTKEEKLGMMPYPNYLNNCGKLFKVKIKLYHKDQEMRKSHTRGWQDDTECFLI